MEFFDEMENPETMQPSREDLFAEFMDISPEARLEAKRLDGFLEQVRRTSDSSMFDMETDIDRMPLEVTDKCTNPSVPSKDSLATGVKIHSVANNVSQTPFVKSNEQKMTPGIWESTSPNSIPSRTLENWRPQQTSTAAQNKQLPTNSIVVQKNDTSSRCMEQINKVMLPYKALTIDKLTKSGNRTYVVEQTLPYAVRSDVDNNFLCRLNASFIPPNYNGSYRFKHIPQPAQNSPTFNNQVQSTRNMCEVDQATYGVNMQMYNAVANSEYIHGATFGNGAVAPQQTGTDFNIQSQIPSSCSPGIQNTWSSETEMEHSLFQDQLFDDEMRFDWSPLSIDTGSSNSPQPSYTSMSPDQGYSSADSPQDFLKELKDDYQESSRIVIENNLKRVGPRRRGAPRLPTGDFKQRNKQSAKLWEWILYMLDHPNVVVSVRCSGQEGLLTIRYGDVLYWEDRSTGLFKLAKNNDFTALYNSFKKSVPPPKPARKTNALIVSTGGVTKQRGEKIDFNSITRAIRHGYKKDIFVAVPNKKKYRFGPNALDWENGVRRAKAMQSIGNWESKCLPN